MKLEYLYDNNNNLKYTMKVFSIVGLFITLVMSLLCFWMLMSLEKNIDYFLLLTFVAIIVITIIFYIFIFSLIIVLVNKYKRKKFVYIKKNGCFSEGEIIMANYHSKGYGRYKWLWKDSGDITVRVKNKTYVITDIDYNVTFKNLIQKLNDNVYINEQKVINEKRHFKNTGRLNKIDFNKITIGIYVLDNNAVADFNSIKVK